MEINKICEWCKKPFKARKTTSKTCSEACVKKYYAWRKRQEKIELAGRTAVAAPALDTHGQTHALNVTLPKFKVPAQTRQAEPELLDMPALASVTGISEPTLYRMLKSDPDFPKIKIRRLLRFHKPTVLEYIIQKYTVYERTSETNADRKRKKG